MINTNVACDTDEQTPEQMPEQTPEQTAEQTPQPSAISTDDPDLDDVDFECNAEPTNGNAESIVNANNTLNGAACANLANNALKKFVISKNFVRREVVSAAVLRSQRNGRKGGRPRIPIITPDLGEVGLEGKLPPKPIDLDVILHWIDLGATAEEIAGSFRISFMTLNKALKELTGLGFEELKNKCCGGAKIALRKNQFALAKNNATMSIWLGKQWLGQKDHVEIDGPKGKQVLDLVHLIEENEKLKEKLAQLESQSGTAHEQIADYAELQQ